jgi:hypothetical protein
MTVRMNVVAQAIIDDALAETKAWQQIGRAHV